MQYPDALSLADGFLLGKDDGFSREFSDLVRKTGVTHIVAASGANLVFLERIFSPVFVAFSYRTQKALLLLVCGIYFLTVGSSGSLWRAMVMWLFSWGGWWIGRKTSLFWLLLQVVLITALFQAEFLSSASFWLSWLAMVGLMFSRQEGLREKNMRYFPVLLRLRNSVANSFFIGWGVFVAVTVWLWPQYEVFQPHGILVTWGVEPFIPLYMIAALHWRVVQGACTLWSVSLCLDWQMISVQLIQLLFLPIEQWLLWWEEWQAVMIRGQLTLVVLVVFGIFLTLQRSLRWYGRWHWQRQWQ